MVSRRCFLMPISRRLVYHSVFLVWLYYRVQYRLPCSRHAGFYLSTPNKASLLPRSNN